MAGYSSEWNAIKQKGNEGGGFFVVQFFLFFFSFSCLICLRESDYSQKIVLSDSQILTSWSCIAKCSPASQALCQVTVRAKSESLG